MKWYIASRLRHKNSVEKILSILKNSGEEVVFDWTQVQLFKPYVNNSLKCSQIALKISKSLQDVDVFVLLSDESGTDMFIELGMILNEWLNNSNIKIYAIGVHNTSSLLHFHPAIKRIDSLEKVFKEECIEAYESNKEELVSICKDIDI